MMALKLRALLCVITLLSASLVSARQPPAKSDEGGDTTIKRLTTLLNRSGKDYRVKIRITSRSNNGDRNIVYLNATRDADPEGDTLQFKIKGDDTSLQTLCLQCLSTGGVSNCGSGSDALIPEPEMLFPGSILPWEEILVGACGTWVVEKSPLVATTKQLPRQDYQVRLANAAFENSWVSTLVTLDTDSGDPVYFDRIDHHGMILRRIKVLEIGRTGSWRGIRRAIIEIPDGRVLMEVVGFRKGAGKSH